MALESWIEEIAREELIKLENQHPNRFNHLKTELKLFISEPKMEPYLLSPEPISPCLNHYTSTQESSNRKRNLDCGTVHNREFKRKKARKEVRCMYDRIEDNVESAIERAEACLKRIREVKKSLMPPWLVHELRA
ncbi:hypothetical protein LUZ62_035538 [Rhynchospora pubera]|uniref:Uncharacterized protein n=1 Tax=Rhynchospora pubera TaxID=906938 RepID=A0AAV8F267_9POAL|nr:hypothetical protein LUZ62_035538 [Rhynchospora pubera]